MPHTVRAASGPRGHAYDYNCQTGRHLVVSRDIRGPHAWREAGFHLGAWGLGVVVRGADTAPTSGSSFGNKHGVEALTTSSLDRRGQGTTASVGGGRTSMSTLRSPPSGNGGGVWERVQIRPGGSGYGEVAAFL